jgi:hypothetical protein
VLARPKFRRYFTDGDGEAFVGCPDPEHGRGGIRAGRSGRPWPVLAAVSTFLSVLEDRQAKELLAVVVTPESLRAWRRDLAQVREMAANRGMASRADYPAPDVAYVKLPPDPADNIRATGDTLLKDTVIVTLQRRPELSEVVDIGGWRVHSIGDYVPLADLPTVPTAP